MSSIETRLQRLEDRRSPPQSKAAMTFIWGSSEQDAQLAEMEAKAKAEGRELLVIRLRSFDEDGDDKA